MFGRFDEAMSHTKRAQELDPLSLELMWNMGVWLSFSRQYDRAIEQFRKIIEMDSKFIPAHTSLAETYQKKGMYEEAIAELKNANVLGPALGYAYAVAGKRDEAEKTLNDLKEQSKQGYVSPKAFAMVYMGLGDKDQAFEWFNKTVEENPYRINWIKVDPRFDSLRSDPRFAVLLRRMKLIS